MQLAGREVGHTQLTVDEDEVGEYGANEGDLPEVRPDEVNAGEVALEAQAVTVIPHDFLWAEPLTHEMTAVA
jgi:hypothetical protein